MKRISTVAVECNAVTIRDRQRLVDVASGTRRAVTTQNGIPRRGRPTALQGDEAVVGYQGVRGTVLVVDDDEGVRAVMATALEDDGWIVVTAENGRSALEALAAAHPDAIILDLRMPVMDGLAFAERYRAYPEPRAPLILISATVTDSAVHATGAVTGLRKPIDLNVLLSTVRHHAVSTAKP